MEELSQISKKYRRPLEIEIKPHMLDHQFQGRAVLSAMEAVALLADSLLEEQPVSSVMAMADGNFDKFLYLDQEPNLKSIANEIQVKKNGDIITTLITKTASPKSTITRVKEHLTVRFVQKMGPPPFPPPEKLFGLSGAAFMVDSKDLYADLVPFGPAYHNVTGKLFLSENGVVASLQSLMKDQQRSPLGSPFPLDAAFHCACAWGQRYGGFVGFPVGFASRTIFKKTSPERAYITRIFPRDRTPGRFTFDIWIYDEGGVMHEAALGVRMLDISRGKIKPPTWVMAGAHDDPLKPLRDKSTALSVMELGTVSNAGETALSISEMERFKNMGDRRKTSYLGARFCCKDISRRLSGNDRTTPSSNITTTCSDNVRPCCPSTTGEKSFPCSVSHDKRFVIAVSSETAVGVDVEEIGERVMKSRRMYMKEEERTLIEKSSFEPMEGSTRVWTIKEAVAKALGIPLFSAWKKVEVKEMGKESSTIHIDHQAYKTFHCTVDNHVFTLFNTAWTA